MVSDDAKCRIADHLVSPEIRALYLNDALESRCPRTVNDALTDIRASCFGENTIALPTFGDMSLADALRILMNAGLSLQVIPNGNGLDD